MFLHWNFPHILPCRLQSVAGPCQFIHRADILKLQPTSQHMPYLDDTHFLRLCVPIWCSLNLPLQIATRALDWGDWLNQRLRGGQAAHHGDDGCGGGLCRWSTKFPFYSYCTKPTMGEFFVPTRTQIGVILLKHVWSMVWLVVVVVVLWVDWPANLTWYSISFLEIILQHFSRLVLHDLRWQ